MVPAERDALISFAPISKNDGSVESSPSGSISIKVKLVMDPTSEKGPDIVNVPRPGETIETFVVKEL